MRLLKHLLLAFALLPGTVALAEGPDAKGGGKKKSESLEDILQQAGSAGDTPEAKTEAKTDAAPAAPQPGPAKPDEKKPGAVAAPAQPAKPAAPAEPQAPPTDDNDASAEAAPPTQLQAVQQTNVVRRRGPYELGKLDCRVLDGAGIERLLPKQMVAGEEPDLLCRVIVTQPADVATLPHSVTLSVTVGEKETFKQVRAVRISSVGRRALVFVIPSDKVSSYEAADVRVTALLSAPAIPAGGHTVKFNVAPED